MSLGFLMLVHTGFERAAQVARHWAERDCAVVIHVDARVRRGPARRFRESLADLPNVAFCPRVRSDWGGWALVRATQSAAETMLERFPDTRHVFLASGACLPLRPVEELRAWLDARPDTDFVESVTADQAHWAVDGLEHERFTLRFPFSWRRQRRLFDAYVGLQRLLRYARRIPPGVDPHLGSQWWCLTSTTLRAILEAPDRARVDRYFRRVWIPDESYFQTLARRYARDLDSRSLTLSKFDVQGRPHTFYDDHLELLRRSDCFVARKIWPGADGLYEAFLAPASEAPRPAEPNPGRIDRLFARANERRRLGRPGLYNQGRFPHWGWEQRRTAQRYVAVWGAGDVFEDFPAWFGRRVGGRVHGHLFHPARAEFAGGETVLNGGLADAAALRDHRPEQFLANLLWNTRGERQSFLLGPGDAEPPIEMILGDVNATLAVVTGAWAVPLMHAGLEPAAARDEAARLQRIEMAFLELARANWVSAQVTIWTLSDFLAAPVDHLQQIVDEVAGQGPRRLTEAPRMRDLSGLPAFLATLRNGGVKPVVLGDVNQLGTLLEPPRDGGGRPAAVR